MKWTKIYHNTLFCGLSLKSVINFPNKTYLQGQTKPCLSLKDVFKKPELTTCHTFMTNLLILVTCCWTLNLWKLVYHVTTMSTCSTCVNINKLPQKLKCLNC